MRGTSSLWAAIVLLSLCAPVRIRTWKLSRFVGLAAKPFSIGPDREREGSRICEQFAHLNLVKSMALPRKNTDG